MRSFKNSAKFTLIVIDISILILFALAIALPWLITWYVEIRNKDQGLPVVVMLTCYPSFPFAAASLFSLRGILKNVLNGLIFGDKNLKFMRVICLCCLGGSIITFVAGFYYMPFFVISIASAGCSLIVKVIKDIFNAELDSQRDKLYETVREEL